MSEVLRSENNDADPCHQRKHPKTETGEKSFHKILMPNVEDYLAVAQEPRLRSDYRSWSIKTAIENYAALVYSQRAPNDSRVGPHFMPGQKLLELVSAVARLKHLNSEQKRLIGSI